MTITLLELKPSQIKPHKANPRREVGDVDELAASIAEQGIVEPLIVVPDEGGYVAKDGVAVGSFVLIAGHRRLAAAKQAKAKTVPCVIRADLAQDPKGQIELMLVENLQRTDLSPVEEAEAYQMLLTFPGYTQKRIAEKTGRGLDTVRKRIKLAGLPKGALTKVHDGQIPLMHADALLSFQGDDAAFKRLVNVAGTEQFPRVLDELTRKQKAARAGERIRKKLADEGVRVLEGGRYDGGRTLDWLHGPKEVEAHRDCPGFAAIIDIGSWSGTAQPLYVCDQPALHGDDADPMGRQEADAARQAQVAALTAATPGRRAWLRDHCLGDPSDGLGLEVLRQLVHAKIGNLYSKADKEMVAELLAVDAGDTKALARKVDQLDWRQCALLLDLVANAGNDAALGQPHNWSPTSYTKKWRTRLAAFYGYTWSEAEQQVLDAQTAEHEASKVQDDVDADDDDDDDFDGPEWADD
jgi:ParB family chromosome partitioning protein